MWRKLKAALVTSAVWSACGAIWGALTGVALVLLAVGPGPPLLATMQLVAIQTAMIGFAAGGVFSVGLAAFARNRSVGELSRIRVALIGAGAGAAVPAGMALASLLGPIGGPIGSLAVLTGFFAAFGAVSATGLLGIARASPDPELEAGSAPEGLLTE